MKYENYIGLPYASNGRDENGIDCWGLVRLFYKQEYDIELPSYLDEYAGAYDARILNMMASYKNNWARLESPEVGSVVLFNILGEPFHVGIYIGDGKFLHAREGRDSVIETIANVKWAKRIEGYYKYCPQEDAVSLAGLPHPFKHATHKEVIIPGSTLSDVANNLVATYNISKRFADSLAIFVDGIKIAKDKWDTTKVYSGQTIVYKVVPQGGDTLRLIATLAIMYVAVTYGGWLGGEMGFTEAGVGAMEGQMVTTAGGKVIGTMAINMAGMALMNAAFPIRPLTSKDPGTAAPVNAFDGAANQSHRYGAIPVVLGKIRSIAALGAVPYVETLTDTTMLNLSLVWGFGPLLVEDICVGAKTISELYYTADTTAQAVPAPVTILGTPSDNLDAFDKLYPTDVEQINPQIELVNNATDLNPPAIVELQNYAEDIDVVLTFPEGMRKISTKDGGVSEATCGIEITLRKQGETTWSSIPTYHLGNYNSPTPSSEGFRVSVSGAPNDPEYESPLYKWYTLAMGPGGGVTLFEGAATDNSNGDPSARLKALYNNSSYASFLGTSNSYSRLPTIPNGYFKLYSLCFYGQQYLSLNTINYLTATAHEGLQLTSVTRGIQVDSNGQPLTDGDSNYIPSNTTEIVISAGRIVTSQSDAPGTEQPIFNSRQMSGVSTAGNGQWSSFLNTYAVWDTNASVTTFDKTTTVTFPYTGYYKVEASADDIGSVYIDQARIIYIPENGFTSSATNWFYAEAGSTHSLRLKCLNLRGAAGIGVNITYTANSGMNIAGNTYTELTFGADGLFSKRKDAFNFVYKIKNLPRELYSIRVRRTNDDVSEKDEDKDHRYFTKAVLTTVTGYNKHAQNSSGELVPIRVVKNPPNCHLARTFVRLQSTNKVNGSIEGINALLTTVANDWTKGANNWNTQRGTNNPASLFLYVLTHPANAYRVADNIIDAAKYVDLNALAEWHEFCQPTVLSGGTYVKDTTKPWLSYNAVLNSTSSVMDVLKDICSAGKASPNFIDGKWTVVIDKPRSTVVQHFTPHNSWGFESNKVLPRIPDAFRITIADENKGYQANEYRVYNLGKNESNAELFEELSLPGVTNFAQAKHIAQWHMAQLRLRPETYSLSVDFEYLVCNRGDVVRVTHDVPLWGSGSGRIKHCEVNSTSILLTEEILLETGKTYNIRVRTNTGSSVLKTIIAIPTTGYYDTIVLTQPITSQDNINIDDLFMLGEVNKESQELVVLSIEPSTNVSAKLTLADYSPQIYTADLSGYLAYDPNLSSTSTANYLAQITINGSPTITTVISDSVLSEEITSGTYTNVAIVGFTNAPDLSKSAERVQLQVVVGNDMFDSTAQSTSYYALKDSNSIRVPGLLSATIYKARARYTNTVGNIVGPWSDTFFFTNLGKVINYFDAPALSMDLDGTYIVVKPTFVSKPSDFAAFEYRLYKDAGTEDFWELDVTANNIKVLRTSQDARFDLRDQPMPRISTEGITYRVACRSVDRSNNYNDTSTLGTIVIKTIQ